MSDEEIIKRRLLIDGDGTGDDRRLNVLLKQFIKWCSAEQDTPENNQAVFDRLLAQMAQCTFAAAKTHHVNEMIKEELQNYEMISEIIDQNIEMAKNDIEINKEELLVAREIRQNRMEYAMLANLINEQPDRKESIKHLEYLKTHLSELRENKRKLDRKMHFRRNDFYVLMHAMFELQEQLEDSSDDEQPILDNLSTDRADEINARRSGILNDFSMKEDRDDDYLKEKDDVVVIELSCEKSQDKLQAIELDST